MSFYRLIFYSAVIGGWAAFSGWLLGELFFMHRAAQVDFLAFVITSALVGGGIAAALSLLAGAANGQWKQQVPRALVGLGGGLLGGALGGFIGNLIYSLYEASVTRALGWMIMGLAIGSVDGLYNRLPKKIRNGLIGGGLGGFAGGLLFDPVVRLIGGAMSGRATAFVILGVCIGLFIGLAEVILKDAWLTVLAGFRPGRQLILDRGETWLGTSEKAQLPFIAFGAKGVEPIHLRILRRDDGSFVLQDNDSRTGTLVNGRRAQAPVLLQNGDMIQLGANVVRFSESFRRSGREAQPLLATATGARPAAPPPEAIAVGAPPVPPAAAGAGHVRPAARPPVAGIPVSRPAPPPPARQAPPPASPRASPTPVRPAPQPAAPPPAPSSPAAPASAACPICARPAKGTPGKRVCENCGIKF
jgi:hypothetical protein